MKAKSFFLALLIGGGGVFFQSVAINAAEPRVMAYDLNVEYASGNYTFSFKANTAATSGEVVFYDGNVVAKTVSISSPIVKGENSISISKFDLPAIKDMTWAVQLTGDEITDVAELTTDDDKYYYYLPQDVEVDNSPESDYFGTIYVANPVKGASDGKRTHSQTQKAGIYAYDPVLNLENYATGYLPSNVTLNTAAAGKSYRELHRIAINPTNSKVTFVQSTAVKVWEADPANLNASAINLIAGTNIEASSLCFDETGVMYVLDPFATTATIYKFDTNGNSSTFVQRDNWGWTDDRNSIVSDGKGGLWVAQNISNLSTNTHSEDMITHINAEGVVDFSVNKSSTAELQALMPTASNRGQIGYDPKNNILALGGNSKVTLYKVSYETAVPELTVWQTVTLTGSNVDGIAFDYAGNLYAASASVERFYAFALPTTTNTCTTPAKKSLTVSGAVPEGRVYAYDLDLTEDASSYTFSFKANENATGGKVILYNNGSSVKEYAITSSITKGSTIEHSVTKSELPKYAGMTWAVQLTGDEVSQLVEYTDASHKFYFPQGIATNNNPESNHFGKIYVANAQGGVCGGTSVKQLDGIYEYSPLLILKNPNEGYKPAGLSLPDTNWDAIHRVAVDPINDYVVFAKWDTSPYAAYGMNPDNMTGTAVNLSEGIVQPTAICYDKEGALCAVSRDDVQGDKTKRTYSIQRKTAQGVECIYSQKSWLTDGDNSIASDGQGGFWVVSYSKTNTNAFAHITKNKELDFSIKLGEAFSVELPANFNRGQLAYDLQRDILALGGGGKVTLYKVAYDADGKATLTKWLETPMFNTEKPAWNTDGIAFDYAGNLYVASASNERFYAFALPTTTNTCTTPAKKSLTVNGVAIPRVYAYDLRSQLNGDKYEISFKANTSYTSGNIVFYDLDGNLLGDKVAITSNPMSINRADLPENVVNWGVELTAPRITSMDELTDNESNEYKFYLPQGIAIDNSTESDYFGQIYVAQATNGSSDGMSDYTKVQKRGVFVFSPTLNVLNPTPNEGILPANAASVMTDQTRQAIHRIAVNPVNGYVAFAYNVENASSVWSMNPANWAGNASDLISGIDITLANSLCFDEDGALYVLDNANESPGGNIYKIQGGTASLFAAANENNKWASTDNAIVPDGRGGLWVAQNRWSLDQYPVISHVGKNGKIDFAVSNASSAALKELFPSNYTSYRGQCAYNVAEDILAFGGNKKAVLFKITYNANNVPTKIEKLMTTGELGDNIDGLAFDYAGNLYVASATVERFYAFTIPTENNTCITPAKTALYLSKKDMVTVDEEATNNTTLSGSDVNVILNRAFTTAYWQTITLPFAMDAMEVANTFGSGTQVAKLVNSQVESKDNASFVLNFDFVNTIEAGVPYLIKPAKEVKKGQIVEGVEIDVNLTTVSTTDANMIPVLSQTTFPTGNNNYWLANDAYLYDSATTIKGLRAYFQFPNIPSGSSIRARVAFNENEATGVEDMICPENETMKMIENGQLIIIRNGEKYNVQGQLIK